MILQKLFGGRANASSPVTAVLRGLAEQRLLEL
jgi:hypothetical protein